MATTGEVFPTAAATAAEGNWSDNDWTSAGNVVSDNGSTASVTAATYDSPDQTFVLKASGFDFSAIPDGSTINGVTCRINAFQSAGTGSLDLCQLLDTSGAKVGTNQCATPVALTGTTSTVITEGGSSDLWGNSLTAAWVKDPDFGVALGILATSANADVEIDYVTLEIDYTAPTPTTTATARVELGAGSTPATRTGHSLRARARTTSGAGTLRMRLYEGVTAITAELESSALTGSLAEYTFTVPDADAEDITDYADLEVEFRGYSAAGDATVFEVAEVWLQVPASSGTDHTHGVDDSIAGTDALVKAPGLGKADSLAGTDSRVASVGTVRADSAALSDSVDAGGSTDHTYEVDDSIAGTDARVASVGKAHADAAAGTDARVSAVGKAQADTASLTDEGFEKDVTYGLADSAVLTDNADTGGSTAHTHEVDDAIGGTDARVASVGSVRADSGSLTDGQAKALGTVRADAAAGTDARVSAVGKAQADAAVLTDEGLEKDVAYGLADAAVLTDSANTGGSTAHTFSLDDGIAGADTVGKAVTVARADSGSWSDVPAKLVTQARSDAFTGADQVSRQWDASVTLADTGTLADLLDSGSGPIRSGQPNTGGTQVTARVTGGTQVSASSTGGTQVSVSSTGGTQTTSVTGGTQVSASATGGTQVSASSKGGEQVTSNTGGSVVELA